MHVIVYDNARVCVLLCMTICVCMCECDVYIYVLSPVIPHMHLFSNKGKLTY